MKRLLALAFCAFLLAPAVKAETFTVNTGAGTHTVKLNGVQQPGTFTNPLTIETTFTATVPAISLFPASLTPTLPNYTDGPGDASTYEFGMKFKSAKNGQIKAIRFYKAASETGSHTGRIWSATGQLLTSVVFTGETGSGWQEMQLSTPLSITAGTVYVVSVNANVYYVGTYDGLAGAVVNGDLSSIADGQNGLYNETPAAFPTLSFRGLNYFRDIAFVATTAPVPPSAISFTQAQYEAAISSDRQGNNGAYPADVNGPSIGYPCGVPNNYGWKFYTGATTDVQAATGGRGVQTAGAAYNQIYNACGDQGRTRKLMPNARILTSDMVVDYYSIQQQKWIRVIKQPTGGAAFAEDFVNNEATGADFRNEASGYKSVRSGINNAQPTTVGAAGGRVPALRVVEDSQVGYNFHGFGDRFAINWSDVKAIVLSQAQKCVPDTGTDLTDCNKLGYLGQVGLDSWASVSSPYDGFATHGGVSGGRFKPVTTDWQVFTNYVGPYGTVGQGEPSKPPVPQF